MIAQIPSLHSALFYKPDHGAKVFIAHPVGLGGGTGGVTQVLFWHFCPGAQSLGTAHVGVAATKLTDDTDMLPTRSYAVAVS